MSKPSYAEVHLQDDKKEESSQSENYEEDVIPKDGEGYNCFCHPPPSDKMEKSVPPIPEVVKSGDGGRFSSGLKAIPRVHFRFPLTDSGSGDSEEDDDYDNVYCSTSDSNADHEWSPELEKDNDSIPANEGDYANISRKLLLKPTVSTRKRESGSHRDDPFSSSSDDQNSTSSDDADKDDEVDLDSVKVMSYAIIFLLFLFLIAVTFMMWQFCRIQGSARPPCKALALTVNEDKVKGSNLDRKSSPPLSTASHHVAVTPQTRQKTKNMCRKKKQLGFFEAFWIAVDWLNYNYSIGSWLIYYGYLEKGGNYEEDE